MCLRLWQGLLCFWLLNVCYALGEVGMCPCKVIRGVGHWNLLGMGRQQSFRFQTVQAFELISNITPLISITLVKLEISSNC